MRLGADAGHGGKKPGAIYNGVEEADINLDIVLDMAKRLREYGHEVFLTRDKDVSVDNITRVKLMKAFDPHAMISIHCNANVNTNANGIETYYRDDLDYGFANIIQSWLAVHLGMKDRGVHQDVSKLNKHLTLLNESPNIPACLVELGFISNKGDLEKILAAKKTIAEILAQAIHEYAKKRGLI